MAVADSKAPEKVPGSCGARTKRGTLCGQRAGKGTAHVGEGPCRLHGGMLPQIVAKYERAAVLRELPTFGGAIEVGPIEALLACVYRASGVSAWLRLKVEALAADEAVTDQTVSVYVKLEAEWLDKLGRFSKMALDAGVAERQVRIAERTGQRISAALEEAIGPLDLSASERAGMVERFISRLSVLEQTEGE